MSARAGHAKKKKNKEKSGVKTGSPNVKTGHLEHPKSLAGVIGELQQTLGNRAVQKLIDSGEIQAKFTVDSVEDSFEREADRVSHQVMKMNGERNENLQRNDEEPPITKTDQVQGKRHTRQVPESTPDAQSSADNLTGAGSPLSGSLRSFFEPRFGVDFSQVRVHTGKTAARAAKSINARAFTTGNDIVFDNRQYSPGSTEGKQLLAHELTHVVQQRGQSDLGVQKSEPTDTEESLPQPSRIAGEPNPSPEYKIIRIAWTLDDGPTDFTDDMRDVLADEGDSETGAGIRAGTWFIMRSSLGEGDQLKQQLEKMVRMQQENPDAVEFAIHSFHPTEDHVSWFPAGNDIAPKAYDSIEDSMNALTDFVNLLRAEGLTVNFVRLPGGLISELTWYLRDYAGVHEDDRDSTARSIINGSLSDDVDEAVKKVRDDYNTMQAKLAPLGLHLWGGSGQNAAVTSAQSWEAESSGSGLTDDVTTTFNSLVDEFGEIERSRSLVVLAHDTNEDNVKEVGKDILAMEEYAMENGVRVEYYTMSNLFRVLRKEEP